MTYVNQDRGHDSIQAYECLLFDLDDTLYPQSSGLSKACARNIEEFMVEKLGVEESKVVELNQALYREHGTSMAGLKAVGYEFDNDEYHSFVHGRLPYENLKPDHALRRLLLTLPIRKVIFSNGDEVHVARALRRLGIQDCFEMVISFETLNPHKDLVVCKPSENAFRQAFRIAEINPHKTLFFDDSLKNIQTGKRLGLKTVLVETSRRADGADYALESIHNMKEALPDLWGEAKKEAQSVILNGKLAVETQVEA